LPSFIKFQILENKIFFMEETNKQTNSKESVVLKIGMVGDASCGKTSVMVKFVEEKYDEDYVETLGVNFMEKTLDFKGTSVCFSIWDLGGAKEFFNMLPIVVDGASVIFFMFDLTRKITLHNIKDWYRQVRELNKTALPFLIGTKFDIFVGFSFEDQTNITIQAQKVSKAMHAPLVFVSASHDIFT